MAMKAYGSHDECEKHVPYVYSQWCYIDSLDGKPLKHGEILRIQWPDGSWSKERVVLEHGFDTINDMGHNCEIVVDRAYVEVGHRGAKTKVRLGEAAKSAERNER